MIGDDAETGQEFNYGGELNDDDDVIFPSALFFHKDNTNFTIITEYYDNDNSFLSDEKKYIGMTNTHNVNELYKHVMGDEFFKSAKEECEGINLLLTDVFAYVENRNKSTILLYVQYKVDFLNEKKG